MKNKQIGFTLAEVLVTLSIVGIVAALTIPSMVNNFGTATIGPSVAKTVGLIESGMKNIIHRAEEQAEINQADSNETEESGFATNSLTALKFKDVIGGSSGTYIVKSNSMLKELNAFFGANTLSNDEKAYLAYATFYKGGTLISSKYSFITDNRAYKFPGMNSIFVYEPVSKNAQVKGTSDYNDIVFTRIIIDANGSESPNKMGKDIFLFGLTEAGNLVPAGSVAYNNWLVDDKDEPLYTDECSDEIKDGVACAARLAADNWKIKYTK